MAVFKKEAIKKTFSKGGEEEGISVWSLKWEVSIRSAKFFGVEKEKIFIFLGVELVIYERSCNPG